MPDLRGYLHRYWFQWQVGQSPGLDPVLARVGAGLGCGVTAVDVDDATHLIRTVALDGTELPPIASVTEDVDVGTLDAGHVLPNMGDPSVRGVWFPRSK
jgi:hypothetical protein